MKYLEGNYTFQIGDMLKSDGTGYSVVGLQMTLTNLHSKYMWVYYLPTSMFTVTSWVSFLLPPTSYPSRTSLLVTVFLCQIGLFNAVIRDTPNQDGGTKTLFHPRGLFCLEKLKLWKGFSIPLCLLSPRQDYWSGMTALETWCLAMIGLVFEALLAYVVVLFWLSRENALQVKMH